MISYLLILTAIALLIGGILFIIKGWSGNPAEEVVPLSDLAEFKGLISVHPSHEPKPEVRPVTETADQEALPRLTYENNKLREQMEQKEADFSQLTAEIETAGKACEHLRAQENSKAEDYRKSIARIAQEKEELLIRKEQENISKINALEKELADARQAGADRQAHLNDALERLRSENQSLLAQGQETQKQMERLKADFELTQKINKQKLDEASEAAHILQIQKNESDRIQEEILGKQLSQALAAVGEVKKEREQLMQAHSELERDFGQIKDLNTYLLEKEKILEYELTKERAQSLGLEKICEDFKVQIDETAKFGVTNR